jgi:hypothetical protein
MSITMPDTNSRPGPSRTPSKDGTVSEPPTIIVLDIMAAPALVPAITTPR